ncbi:signal peptide peptidase SppA [Methanolobus sp. WCC4]|uniref:signal peptide peptidase SppA n=1 Tax=Methanolobus sp. WCC4 TaxID=3125784 RepID=UPI0030FB71AC
MTGDNKDRKTEDDGDYPGYHTYPYSYDDKEKDSDSSVPSDDKEVRVSENDTPVEDENVVAVSGETATVQTEDNTEDNASGSPAYIAPEPAVEEVKTEPQAEGRKAYTEPSREPPVIKKKSRKWQYVAIIAVLLFVIGASFAAIYQAFNGDIYSSDGKVAVIYIQGTLVTSTVPGGFGYVSSEEISDNIRRALDDEDVKAIVLRVNSGGGSSTAGEEVYSEVKKASESGVPVVVSMGSTAASAAYHLSAPADLIVANPTTMTGSIGTIWIFQNLSKYYDSEGIEYYVVKSGETKDMGYPWRGLSDEEKEYANKVVSQVYNEFIKDVAEGRDMSLSEVKALADGRIYIGSEAKELGLVDEMGNLYDSIDMAAELGGIEGEPTVVYMNKPTLSSLLFSSETGVDVTSEEFITYYEGNPYGYIS